MLGEVPAVVAGAVVAGAVVPPPPAHPLSPIKTVANTSAVRVFLLVMMCRPRRWRGLRKQPGFLPFCIQQSQRAVPKGTVRK
jgi:hypothetical protein